MGNILLDTDSLASDKLVRGRECFDGENNPAPKAN